MTGQFASSVSHMIAIYRMLGACLFVVCIFPVWAQGQSPAPVLTPSLRRVNTSPGRPGSGNAATALSCNYVITLTVLADEKPLREVVLLTASPTVRTNVPLNGRADGSSVSASG